MGQRWHAEAGVAHHIGVGVGPTQDDDGQTDVQLPSSGFHSSQSPRGKVQMAEFFTEVSDRIPYTGPDSEDPLAFHWYDADRVVAGQRMEDQLRFAVCYWHSFNWDG